MTPDRRVAPLWNASQRSVLIALAVGLAIYLGIRLYLNPAYVSDPQPQHPPNELNLRNRIDPNTADVKTLAALPMIGEKRAKDIVAYRERYVEEHADDVAFKRPEDLLRIRGIGRAMVQTLSPYLICPTTQPVTTQESARD
jgi:DNA uptake protein ComE-like DNA-binding protein